MNGIKVFVSVNEGSGADWLVVGDVSPSGW